VAGAQLVELATSHAYPGVVDELVRRATACDTVIGRASNGQSSSEPASITVHLASSGSASSASLAPSALAQQPLARQVVSPANEVRSKRRDARVRLARRRDRHGSTFGDLLWRLVQT
jgi:hypothetical protein